MKFGRGAWLIFLGLGLLLSLSPAHAQSSDDRLFIENETRAPLDEAAIRQAAQPFIEADAYILILLVEQGGDEKLSAYLERRIPTHGRDKMLLLYMMLDPPWTQISYGRYWAVDFELSVYDYLNKDMLPAFREGDYSAAFVHTLKRMSADMSADRDGPNKQSERLFLLALGLALALILGRFSYLLVQGFRGALSVDE